MGYRILKRLIQVSTKTNAELLDMADVYYGANRLTQEQYEELVALINARVENDQ